MKKLFALFFACAVFTLCSLNLHAQCPAANNLQIWNETDETITIYWTNSLNMAKILINGVPYSDGNSGYIYRPNTSAVVAEKCRIAHDCGCTYNAGDILEIAVFNFCDWPMLTSFSVSNIVYTLQYPIECEKKKGKKNK